MGDVDFTCSYHSEKCVTVIWKIKDFSKIKRELKRSQKFIFSGLQWRIGVRVRKKNVLSEFYTPNVFLLDGKPKEFGYKFFIKDKRNWIVRETDVRTYYRYLKSEGCLEFSDVDDLLDDIVDDTLTVHCEIFDNESVSEEHSETRVCSCFEDDYSNYKEHYFNYEDDYKKYEEDYALADDLETLLNSGEHSDVVLKVGDVSSKNITVLFPAHKLILSSRSEEFRAMFRADTKENASNCVDLVDISPDVVEMMLCYMYTERLDGLSENNALDLYAAADKYSLLKMRSRCRDFILEHLSVENVCDVAIFGDLHADLLLKEATEELFSSKMKAVFKTERWRVLKEKKLPFLMSFVENAVFSNPFVLE